MKLKEKLIRKLNAEVQKSSNISPETKLMTQNAELALDITQRLADLTSDSDSNLSDRKSLNEKLRHIMDVLQK